MSGVGRRVLKAIEECLAGDNEAAAMSVFSAIDATSKIRYPDLLVGKRFRGFLKDQEDLITSLATGSSISLSIGGVTLADAVWKFARNPLVHEAEMDSRISFDNSKGIEVGEVWNLPSDYLLGFAIAVISARENKDEDQFISGGLVFCGQHHAIQDLWGKEDELRQSLLLNKFGWGRR